MRRILLSAALSSFVLFQPAVFAVEIPSELKALHVLNRLGFGPSPGDVKRVYDMGVDNYIEQQLHPENIPLPASLTQQLNTLTTYTLGFDELTEEYGPPPRINGQRPDPELVKAQRKKAQIIVQEAMQGRLMQAIESPRQLQELLVDFWYNHFNVFAQKGLDHLWIGDYERNAIRPYVLGRFRDLLEATAKHPAMLFYLDNWQNVDPNSFKRARKARGLNENYARELMELHTLGVNGGYSQDDVITLAKILTGWGFHGKQRGEDQVSYGFEFNPRRHDANDQVFIGQNISGGGQEEVEAALDILSRSPQTAQHICYQLAQFFVSDDPDPQLVSQLTQVYETSDGDIRAVLETLFKSPEFWDEKNYQTKFKTPFQYVVSVIRASGEQVTNYRPLMGMLQQLGEPLYGCLTPDGYKNTQAAWLNPDGMLRRINFATAIGFGRVNINDDQFPVSEDDLLNVFDHQFSASTMQAVDATAPRLRAVVLLGSPEMMKK